MSVAVLSKAFARRESALAASGAVRIFHGPGESPAGSELSRVAIELFRDEASGESHAWVFVWEEKGRLKLSPGTSAGISEFLRGASVASAVVLERPERGTPEDPAPLFGVAPASSDVLEKTSRYRIRYLGTKHPGLFLDHLPLRDWLRAGGRDLEGKRVLNTFAYTGSLSVAARQGGAAAVTTLDLSKPTIAWARENWELNFGAGDSTGDFIYGDVFEWMPKLEKRGERYDVVILDPPSFSRSEKRVFSTAKDLPDLHGQALRLLAPNGLLITSINSAKISEDEFREEIEKGARSVGRRLSEVKKLGAPADSFPGAGYLKGWVLRAR
jgi:23S rRNA (cytosine1962-C5)-methyltransferase